jgi:hypothetical protein
MVIVSVVVMMGDGVSNNETVVKKHWDMTTAGLQSAVFQVSVA